ncbi:MAG TPA: hypothetical protein PLV82_03175 [bacterium]|nr:hypothetical protein [bacterium]
MDDKIKHVRAVEVFDSFILGLDLGQVNDFTGLVIAERIQTVKTGYPDRAERVIRARDWHEKTIADDAMYYVRHIERVKLGTPYPDIVQRVQGLVQTKEINNNYLLAVDHTGVGRPVYDLFKKAGLNTLGITITGGNTVTGSRDNVKVAKSLLVGTVQALIQTKRVVFAKDMANVDLLQNELLNFRVKITKSANEIYEAREGEHDDLVIALAMALFAGERFCKPKQSAKQHSYL